MLYLYDRAICKDLENSFNLDNVDSPVVRVIGVEESISVAAQIKNDELSFPIVALFREASNEDTELSNFTRLHRGVTTVFDTQTNQYFYEKSIPWQLSYSLTILTTNQADLDELMRELLFKYTQMYFLTITLPYEAHRDIRFGVVIDSARDIEQSSGVVEYMQSGKLYQAIVPLRLQGAVLVHYTPVSLRRFEVDVQPE